MARLCSALHRSLWRPASGATAAAEQQRQRKDHQHQQRAMPACGSRARRNNQRRTERRRNAHRQGIGPGKAGNPPGKSRLIKPGNNTFPSAIPQPITAVPVNSRAAEGRERTAIPAQISNRARNRLRSMPIRRATPAASGETRANANSGRVVSRPLCAVVNPYSRRMVSSSGAAPVK